MTSTDRRVVVLSTRDIPGDREHVVHNCEDCACPVSGERTARDLPALVADPLVRAGDVVEVPLDQEHFALFSPNGDGGVVVLDTAGRALLDTFADPTPASAVVAGSPALERAIQTLVGFDVLHPVGKPPTPRFESSTELTAWLHVTNKCNLRCPYCYVHKSDDSMDADVAKDSVNALVASAQRHGFRSLRLKYAGGEASMNAAVLLHLHDHALALCREAGLGLSAVLLSNGVALNGALVSALRTRDIRVMISLDGLGETHDAQRPTVAGKPSAALVLRTIDRLLAAGISPHLSITVTSRNIDGIADVVRMAVRRDLTFSVNFFRDNDCSASFDDLQYEEQAMVDGLDRTFAVIEELLPRRSVLGSVLDRGQLVAPRRRACGVGDDYVVIDQNGGIAQCHMEIARVVGDVRTDDPVSAIRSGTGVRNLLVDTKSGCRDCTWRHWCSSGCSAATFRATGRWDVQSPNCGIYRAIYPRAVRLEGLRILRYATTAD
ncbi:radical SAM/SPASM domain-containing protein [Actinokineospora diospyrosa]|uniref:Radical SAM core domain-containing protein n=1 Tax=Actinokineospora diospyrosa TaxID=103728 RepID=A0ABT1I9K9_9PSEU|nr:radical SAM protein [Actinokineospora diospyrosa]MCP2269324.1 uncharacterized protein [Actinokineospora diospyrosa]